MILTGERVVPKLMKHNNGLLIEHIKRYEFASKFAKGRVLDIACGTGYGCQILLENDKSRSICHIAGVDIDAYTIKYAKTNYPHEKVSYLVKDAESQGLEIELGGFDTIVSFETIEHLKHDAVFVNSLSKLLNSSGNLIISTPFGRGRGIPCSNPYHVHQYKEEEFIQLLRRFKNIDMYYQRNEAIEKPTTGKEYYIMIAVCSN